MPGCSEERVICLYCLIIGGRGFGILRMGFEQPVSIKREEMIMQKNNDIDLCGFMGFPRTLSNSPTTIWLKA
jgi:hypothetical protein